MQKIKNKILLDVKPLKKKRDYTEGSILKALIFLSLPIVLANILQTIYQLTDTFWVGRLGADAVAAVSISFPIIFLLVSFAGGLAIAGSVLVAQYYGKKDYEKVDYVSMQTIIVVGVFSILLSAIGLLSSEHILRLLGAEEKIVGMATAYLGITFVGLFFVFLYMIFQAILRGIGEVKIPLLVVLGTVLLNFVLDPIFIFGFNFSGVQYIAPLGVSGAAIATIICQGLAGILGLLILIRGKRGIKLHFHHFKLDFVLAKKIFLIGIPSSIEQMVRSLGMLLMIFFVTSFGTLILASYGLGTRILALIIIPALGFSMASTTLVAQNIGASKMSRAEQTAKVSVIISFIVLTLIGVVMFFFARDLSLLFVPEDLALVTEATFFLQVISFSFGLIGVQMVLNGVFRGAGDTVTPMNLSILSLILLIGLAYLFAFVLDFGYNGIWFAYPVSSLLTTIIAIFIYLKGDWKKIKLIHEHSSKENFGKGSSGKNSKLYNAA